MTSGQAAFVFFLFLPLSLTSVTVRECTADYVDVLYKELL